MHTNAYTQGYVSMHTERKLHSNGIQVDEFNAMRMKMTAEMVDSSNLLKTLVVKAEDYRIINDMNKMKKTYTQLAQINTDLFAEYTKRSMNHQELLLQLKNVSALVISRIVVRGVRSTQLCSV